MKIQLGVSVCVRDLWIKYLLVPSYECMKIQLGVCVCGRARVCERYFWIECMKDRIPSYRIIRVHEESIRYILVPLPGMWVRFVDTHQF